MIFVARTFFYYLCGVHIIDAFSSSGNPSSSLVSSHTSYSDRIRNSQELNRIAAHSLKNANNVIGIQDVDIIAKRLSNDLPLSFDHAKRKIDQYIEECTSESITQTECLRDFNRITESGFDMLEAVVSHIEEEQQLSQKVFEIGNVLYEKTKDDLSICYLGAATSVGGSMLALTELLLPAILPGALGGPAGFLYATLTLGGAWLTNQKCQDPMVAYMNTVKMISATGVAFGLLLVIPDIVSLRDMIAHLDASNIDHVASILQSFL